MKFEGPPSPFIEPEINRYRKERENIENALLKLDLGSLCSQLFGVSHSSLTETQKDQLEIFAFHVGKRLLNAFSQKEGGISKRLLGIKYKLISPESVFQYLVHDMSHAAGIIIQGKTEENDNSIVPPFLKYKNSFEFNRKELLEDECYGDLWGYDPDEMLDLAKDSPSLEVFIKEYVQGCLQESLESNKTQVKAFVKNQNISYRSNRKKLIQELGTGAEAIIAEIAANPPQEIVRLLTYIWEHRENPRVLADLFFQEVGPYLSELQKRKAYSFS
jgi:hypothetical protein